MKYLNSFIITTISIVMGLFSALLMFSAFAVLFVKESKAVNEISEQFPKPFLIITFIALWLLSSGLMIHFSKTISRAFRLSFLLLASDWLFLLFAFITKFSLSVLASTNEINKSPIIEILAGGTILLTPLALCILMSFGCMIGYAISVFFPRELKTKD